MRYRGINLQNYVKHLVSVLFGLIPMLVLFFILSPVEAALDKSVLSVPVRMILISAFFIAITAVPCYFICRHNSRSVWYVPALVVLSSMWIVSDLLSNYWTTNAKLWLFVIDLTTATILGILGSLKREKIRGD